MYIYIYIYIFIYMNVWSLYNVCMYTMYVCMYRYIYIYILRVHINILYVGKYILVVVGWMDTCVMYVCNLRI